MDDAKKWLANRGYVLPEGSDMVSISDKALIHEMAEVYHRLSRRFGGGR